MSEMKFRNTPAPWQWHKRDKSCNGELLLVHPHRGFLVVMDFVRHGMQGGQPRFATWKGDQRANMGGIMKPAKELDVAAHPDAMVIAAAPLLLESTWALHNILLQYTDYQSSEWCAKAKAALAAAGCPGYEVTP